MSGGLSSVVLVCTGMAGALTSINMLVCVPWRTGPWRSVGAIVNPLLLHGSGFCPSQCSCHSTFQVPMDPSLVVLYWEQGGRGSCISNMYSDANYNIYLEGNPLRFEKLRPNITWNLQVHDAGMLNGERKSTAGTWVSLRGDAGEGRLRPMQVQNDQCSRFRNGLRWCWRHLWFCLDFILSAVENQWMVSDKGGT